MKKPGRYLAGVFVLMMMAARSFGSFGGGAGSWTAEKVAINGYHINQGVFYFTGTTEHQIVFECNQKQVLLDMSSAFPIDLSNTAVAPVMGNNNLHAAVIDKNGILWATDNSISPPSVRGYEIVTTPIPALNLLYTVAGGPGGVCDGIAYDPNTNRIFTQTWYDGVYAIDISAVPIPPAIGPTPSFGAKIVSTPTWRGDHLSVSVDGAFVFGVGWSASVAWRFEFGPPAAFDIMDDTCMYSNGSALDGTASLVPFIFGNPTQSKRPYWKSYVFFNHMSGQLFILPTTAVAPINCATDVFDVWATRPAGFGGEGVAAPGDGFLYAYNFNEGTNGAEIWRHTDPSPGNIQWMPLKPGDSVLADLFCLMHSALRTDCIQPAGLAFSLISRMEDVTRLLNQRKFGEAKKRLRSEVLAGLQGIDRNHVSCPEVLDGMIACVNTLLKQLSE